VRQLTLQEHGNHENHRLALRGELDRSNIAEFDAAIARLCDRGAMVLAVDMREVTFIDSSAIRSLIAAAELCRRRRTELRVMLSPQLRRVFEIRGLFAVLPMQEAGELRPR
jgi:anti-anti-sigma factor